MARSTYGFTSLMEAVNNEAKSETVLSDIHEAVSESASFLDIGQDFIGEDELYHDMDSEDDYISPEDAEKLDRMLDKIEPTDDVDSDISEADLESLDATLESYLEENDL